MADVKLININKIYEGDNHVVHDVNLHIHDREFIVLVGPSGCGKSTTLRMVAGLEEISSGELLIDEKKVNDVPPKDRDIAMVFQNYALYPHMTVYENLAFGLKLRKFDKTEIERRVKDAAKILGIEELLGRKPKQLSGGQRQRVAVGRAIVRKPKLFLFDEPLSNLDAKLRVQMRTEISKLHRELGATIIYVTHDQVEAMTMGDKIAVMNKGVVQQFDSPLNLYNSPVNKFVAGFLGNPSMNFIEGKIINNDGLTFVDESSTLQIKLTKESKELSNYIEEKITMGIRPEDISVYELKSPSLREGLGWAFIETTIEVAEMLGNEIFIYFNIGTKQLVSRVPVNNQLHAGMKIKMKFNLEKLYFFDSSTDKTIGIKI
ncbi:MAG: sn-glycerol-3-phosphate ABC transporter ATP-binding protein UgpC [Bacteroidota bacterium]